MSRPNKRSFDLAQDDKRIHVIPGEGEGSFLS